jgi:hypothetical protein
MTIATPMLLCILVAGLQARPLPAKPTLTPMFMSYDAGRGPAFLIECTNTTSQTQSSGSEVWPLTRSAVRLDGQQLREVGGRIGPGVTIPVAPGETWRGIIELWQTEQAVSRAVVFGAMVRAPMLLPVSQGRHTIAVRCDQSWSDEVVFFLDK